MSSLVIDGLRVFGKREIGERDADLLPLVATDPEGCVPPFAALLLHAQREERGAIRLNPEPKPLRPQFGFQIDNCVQFACCRRVGVAQRAFARLDIVRILGQLQFASCAWQHEPAVLGRFEADDRLRLLRPECARQRP
jgi:hypothetical protein